MITAQQVIARARADKCLTPSRSSSHRPHRNYSNKYTKLLGKLGYKGIKKNGYFSKIYPYGVVGHCCIFAQYWLIRSGYRALVPIGKGFIWNTNKYASWLKSEPQIKGLGRVDWTTDPGKASKAANAGKMVVVFKGRRGHGSYTHTCILLKVRGNYIYTVDGNVGGRYKGKRINNGVVKKRRYKSYRWGFAILPIPTTKPATYKKGKTYTLQNTMNVRTTPSVTKGRVKATIKRGSKVKALAVVQVGRAYWVKTVHGWICAKTPTKTYLK